MKLTSADGSAFLGQPEVPLCSPCGSRPTLFCGFMSEVIWAAVDPPTPPPHRSAFLHLARRSSELISGGRAKGWRPWPDPPEDGVCAKRFYSGWGDRGETAGPAALRPRSTVATQQAPALRPSEHWCVWWEVFVCADKQAEDVRLAWALAQALAALLVEQPLSANCGKIHEQQQKCSFFKNQRNIRKISSRTSER